MQTTQIFLKKRSVKTGLPPGTLIHTGKPSSNKVTIHLITYGPEIIEELYFDQLKEYHPAKDSKRVSWINIDGLHDLDVIRNVGETFKLHPLVLEDIVNTVQRPKVEDYEVNLFIVLNMLSADDAGAFTSEQLSLVLGPDYVITFQENITGDVFEGVRNRVRSAKGKIREMGPDYLAYSLIDAITDAYFDVLEAVGEKLINLEEQLTISPSPETLQLIHEIKKDVIYLRKSIWPLREAIASLGRGESKLIKETTAIYFRDVYDHIIQAIETVETYRDLLSGMLDLYLSSVSNRTNEVMKFLTVIGTIFLPLTFLVGVYGMNFKYMPELNWPFGYFGLWATMIFITLMMILYFRRKHWI